MIIKKNISEQQIALLYKEFALKYKELLRFTSILAVTRSFLSVNLVLIPSPEPSPSAVGTL